MHIALHSPNTRVEFLIFIWCFFSYSPWWWRWRKCYYSWFNSNSVCYSQKEKPSSEFVTCCVLILCCLCHFHINYYTPCWQLPTPHPSPSILTAVPREIESNAYAQTLGGILVVSYGKRRKCWIQSVSPQRTCKQYELVLLGICCLSVESSVGHICILAKTGVLKLHI